MTLHPPDEATNVKGGMPHRPASRSWRSVAVAALLAVLLVAAGITLGRATTADPERAEPFDLAAFEAAQGSGDADQIRAFYTEDAVMMPFGHILATLSNHPMPEYWDVHGPDMDREAAEHEGGTFEILDIGQIGNMVVATGQWSFPEGMFPDSELTVIKTADVAHLREGKIWRQFGSFEVYVDGTLIEM